MMKTLNRGRVTDGSCIIFREVTIYLLKLDNHDHKHLSEIFRHAMIKKKKNKN